MRAIRSIVLVVFAAVLAACATSKHPVGISQGAQADTRLLGAWRAVDPENGDSMYAFFLPRSGSTDLEALSVSPPRGETGGGWRSYAIVLGKAGEHRFLNARVLFEGGKPGKADDAYTPVLYRFRGRELRLSFPDVEAVKRAVQAGELAGEIKGESVTITTEPAVLDAYVAAHAGRLFKRTEAVLRRVD
jgi:hypothetical protein